MSPEDVASNFSITDAIAQLAQKQDLNRGQARAVMDVLLTGKATPAQIGAVLMGLRLKGVEREEFAGLVEGMRQASLKVTPERDVLVDLCGTGGDGSGTFNISTAAALVVAASGVGVAKHGNRSASSKCGSADVLEALGIPIDLSPERATQCIEELGFAFLFARQYHPAMKHVGGVRQELKTRTVFNFLGPLTNPAGVKRQLLGVSDDSVRELLADASRLSGSERVWVVHGEGGLDELTIAGESHVTEATPEGLEEFTVSPEQAGLSRASLETLAGGDAKVNAEILEKIFAGETGPRRDVVLLNAGAALVVAGVRPDLRAAVECAAGAIDSGAAAELLAKLRGFR